MTFNKRTLLIVGAAAAALLAFKATAKADVRSDGLDGTIEKDDDRIFDAPPAERQAAREVGKGGIGKTPLQRVQEGTDAAAHGVATVLGAGVSALGRLLGR